MSQVPKVATKSPLQAHQVLSGVLMGTLTLSAAYMFITLLLR